MKKAIKSVLSAILTAVMILSLLPSTAVTAASNYSDAELARAVTLGFGSYRTDNPAVTYAEFMKMLDRTVELADKSKLTAWQKIPQLQKARNSKESMTRSDGMFAVLCAAETLGGDYARNNCVDWGDQWLKLGNWQGKTGQDYNPNGNIFGGDYINQTPKVLFNPQDGHESRNGDALVYSFARASHFSKRPIFDVDVENNTMRAADPLLYTEALLAALRLYDSGSRSIPAKDVNTPKWTSERYLTDADKKILANAEARKQSILKSTTKVNVTGTKYYVSNKGSDNNDGKSPDKAWATIDKVNKTALKPGDGVFFERGGVWRNAFLWCSDGVTYSAYGEGEKPKLFGSPENGADEKKWTLVPGTKNVWQFHIKMNEVGLMLVNNDEHTTDKYVAFWDVKQQKYVVTLDMKTPFSLNLLENHQFFCDTDLKGLVGGQVALSVDREIAGSAGTPAAQNGSSLVISSSNRTGNFYFRCDEGNPGKVYSSIEFAMVTYSKNDGGDVGGPIVNAQNMKNITIDNLCVKYSGDGGIFVGKGCTVQNCEIGYIGGAVIGYTPLEKLGRQPKKLRELVWVEDGHGIIISNASDMVISNNYIHDTINSAVNIEHMLNGVYKNLHVKNNLCVRNGVGIMMFNFFAEDDPNTLRFQDMYIDNNYWLYTGYFADRGDHGFSYPMHEYDFYHPQQFKNINYTNNVFYVPKCTLFHITGGVTLSVFNFSGNTYAHLNGGVILRDDRPASQRAGSASRLFYDKNAEKTIKQLTGDKTAIVLPVSYPPSS